MNDNKRIALVTGASRGLGFAAALELAKQGWHVIALARTQSGLEALDDAVLQATRQHATLVPLDLGAPDAGINALGAQLFERFGRLNALILNAATLPPLSPIPHVMEKDWQRTLDVNLTANFRLLRSLDPLLRAAQNPHIAFVTCGKSSMGHAYWGAYAASKKALKQLAKSYRQENESAGFAIHRFDPGPLPTQLRKGAFPGEDQGTLPKLADTAKTMISLLANN